MGQGGRITRIEAQKRHPHRRSVFLDGKFGFGLDEEVVYKAGLQEGEELTAEQIDEILLKEEKAKAKDRAFHLLSFRARSCREVRDRLKEKGYDPRVVEEVIADLQRLSLLNDDEFARSWIRDRLQTKPMGRRRLRQELQKKGIDPELIEQAIEDGFRDVDEVELAVSLLRQREARYRGLNEGKARRRMADFLARRGFSWEVITAAMERVKKLNHG